MIDCSLSGDAECLLGYVTSEERKALDLRSTNLRAFLREFFLPSLSGFRRNGPARVENSSSHESVLVSQELIHADGRAAGLAFLVGRTSAGNKTTTLIVNLATTALSTQLSPGEPNPHGVELRKFWVEKFGAALPTLEKTGVDGLLLDTEMEPIHLTWQGFIDRQRYYIKRAEDAARSPQPQARF